MDACFKKSPLSKHESFYKYFYPSLVDFKWLTYYLNWCPLEHMKVNGVHAWTKASTLECLCQWAMTAQCSISKKVVYVSSVPCWVHLFCNLHKYIVDNVKSTSVSSFSSKTQYAYEDWKHLSMTANIFKVNILCMTEQDQHIEYIYHPCNKCEIW